MASRTERREPASTTFSTRAAARILALPPERIRYWVKRRLISPADAAGRQYRFAFSDLLLMRLAKELLPMRQHLRRLRQCFESVHRYLGSSGPMTSVKLSNEDGRIVLYRGGAWIEPESGQLLFRFDHGEAAGEVEERFGQARVQGRLEEARAAAERDPGRAQTIYRELAQLDPRNFEVRMELARALHDRGDLDAALSHVRAAVELRPAELRAHLEAARILQERGELEEALASLRSALQCDGRSAETHRALAEIYERLGRKNEALKHLSAAHRLSRDA